MLKYFSANGLFMKDPKAATLVENGIDLAKRYTATLAKGNDKLSEARQEYANVLIGNYEKDNNDFMEAFMQYCVEGSNYEWTGIEMVKNRQVRNAGFMDRFYDVVGQIMTPVAPAVVSTVVINLAETRNIALGDTAQFRVDSNELFQVDDLAEGLHQSATQRLYNEEFTVNPTQKAITVSVDWLFMATGKLDFGAWAYKIGLSFAGYINKLIYKALVDGIASMPAAYKAGSYSDDNFIGLKQRVKAANANSAVYCYGTAGALGKVLPSNDYLKMQLGEEWFKNGYVGMHKGVPMMEIDQVITPGTVNTTATLGIDDNYLWFFALGGYKPVKLVFEGSALAIADEATKTADKTQMLSIQQRFGAKLIVGSRYGQMTVS